MKSSKLVLNIFVLSIFLIGGPSLSFACGVNACNENIERTYVRANGDVLVATTGNELDLDCQATSNNFLTLRKSSANFSEIYSMILASDFARRKLTLRIVNGSKGCDIGYVTTTNTF